MLANMREAERNRYQTDRIGQRINRAEPAVAEAVCCRADRGARTDCRRSRRADQQQQADISAAHQVVLALCGSLFAGQIGNEYHQRDVYEKAYDEKYRILS